MDSVVGGSSCCCYSFVQSPLHFPFSFNSQSSVSLYARNADTKKRNRDRLRLPSTSSLSSVTMAFIRPEHVTDDMSNKRRAVLLVGISVLPFLQLRARALEGLVTKESEPNTPQESQKEEGLQRDSPSNPFLSFLNALGIFGTAVLGPLYALTRKEKKASDAAIESMKDRLKEKEAAIIELEKEFEFKLLKEQEEQSKQLKTAKEEQQVLVDQLNSANSTITGLGQELKNEKLFIEDLKVQIDSLRSNLLKAEEDKSALHGKLKEKLNLIEVLNDKINLLGLELRDKDDCVQNLSSSLADKEVQLKNLNFTYKQTEDGLAKADAEIKILSDELLKNEKELESRNSLVDELSARVSSLIVERDDSRKKIDAVQKEYDDLKLSSEKKAALHAKLLGEREEKLRQLKEKLDLAKNEVSGNQAIIDGLTQENDDLRKKLDGELSNRTNLKHELETTKETLGKTRNEASDLAKQLYQSRSLCSEFQSEISRFQAEFAEAKESFQNSLDEAKQSGEVVASELTASKELLKKTSEELLTVTHQLAATAETRDSLQKELVDVYRKAEAAANDLKEEKNIVSSLKNELQVLERQILKDKEGRKSLETDLEEATKSLDEMNRNALTLSRELDKANAHISSLKDEKEVLYKSLTEQTDIAKEAHENMEDAHNLVVKLGQERDSLVKRAKKLEEELASAKGEVLRLRSQINSSKAVVNDQPPQNDKGENNVTVSAKRTGRRRKDSSSNSDDEDNVTVTSKRTGRRRKATE